MVIAGTFDGWHGSEGEVKVGDADGAGTGANTKGGTRDGASVKPEVQARLGDKLKEVYSDVLNEPVPDRFMQLLDQLAAKGPANGSGGGDRG